MVSKMMLKRILLILFSSLLLLGTGLAALNTWKTIKTPPLHSLNDLWFSGDSGIIAGYFQSLENRIIPDIHINLSKQEAIILHLSGLKKQWKKVWSGAGEILQISHNNQNEIIFALGRQYISDGSWKAFLLFSEDKGRSWNEDPNLPENIEGIGFQAKDVSYAWSLKRLYLRKGRNSQWQPLDEIDFRLDKNKSTIAVAPNGNLWFVDKGKLSLILPDGRREQETLPQNFSADILSIGPDQAPLLLGRKGDKKEVLLLKRKARDTFDIITSLPPFYPKQLFLSSATGIIVGSDQSSMPPQPILLRSTDGGKGWKAIPSTPEGTTVFYDPGKALWKLGTRDRLLLLHD